MGRSSIVCDYHPFVPVLYRCCTSHLFPYWAQKVCIYATFPPVCSCASAQRSDHTCSTFDPVHDLRYRCPYYPRLPHLPCLPRPSAVGGRALQLPPHTTLCALPLLGTTEGITLHNTTASHTCCRTYSLHFHFTPHCLPSLHSCTHLCSLILLELAWISGCELF